MKIGIITIMKSQLLFMQSNILISYFVQIFARITYLLII